MSSSGDQIVSRRGSNGTAVTAAAQREQKAPTLEQVKHVINTMPCSTEIELPNRALVAFTIVRGARGSAIASMKLKLKHVDLSSLNARGPG
jgi:hypothetical protein